MVSVRGWLDECTDVVTKLTTHNLFKKNKPTTHCVMHPITFLTESRLKWERRKNSKRSFCSSLMLASAILCVCREKDKRVDQ